MNGAVELSIHVCFFDSGFYIIYYFMALYLIWILYIIHAC